MNNMLPSDSSNPFTSSTRGLFNQRVSPRLHARDANDACERQPSDRSERRLTRRREERGSDDESRRCAPGFALAYSLTEEDVALRSVCTGLGAHTSRCAASGGNTAVRGVGA
jgi:hypothetical protein